MQWQCSSFRGFWCWCRQRKLDGKTGGPLEACMSQARWSLGEKPCRFALRWGRKQWLRWAEQNQWFWGRWDEAGPGQLWPCTSTLALLFQSATGLKGGTCSRLMNVCAARQFASERGRDRDHRDRRWELSSALHASDANARILLDPWKAPSEAAIMQKGLHPIRNLQRAFSF